MTRFLRGGARGRARGGGTADPAGRGTVLTPEDIALWRRVTASLRRLREDDDQSGARRPVSPGPDQGATPASDGLGTAVRPATASVRPASSPASPAAPRTELSRRELRRLKKGNRALDAVIDLHGFDRIAAHDHLLARLRSLQEAGARTVLVVTGKGRGGTTASGEERGVLSRLLPLWLGEPSFRMLVHTAHRAAPHHGGQGAVYLLLRKRPRGRSS